MEPASIELNQSTVIDRRSAVMDCDCGCDCDGTSECECGCC
jgi:hypothetical protein